MAPAERVSVEPVTVKRRVVVSGVPVVVVDRQRSARKRGRRRYTGGVLYSLGVFEHRVLGGLGRAGAEYEKRSNRSARETKDGAVRDLFKNASRASEKMVSQTVLIPRDMMRSRAFNDSWRMLRRITRVFSM